MSKVEHKVEPVAEIQPIPPPKPQMDIGALVSRIESMSGPEKKAFCRTLSADEKAAYIKYLRDRDCEEIEVVFRCFEPMGGMVKFTGIPYPGVGQTWELYDNMKYKLPLCIAKRFNNEFQGLGTFYPTHSYIVDQNGSPVIGVGKRNYRFGTTSPNLV